MNNKKAINPPINPGLSLLLVTFLVLCLFTFSAISLASAKNEVARSLNFAQNTRDYYKAANEAQISISNDASHLTESKDYVFPINKYQNLEVSVTPTENGYNITKWIVTPATQWEGDNTYNLFLPVIDTQE